MKEKVIFINFLFEYKIEYNIYIYKIHYYIYLKKEIFFMEKNSYYK